MRRLLLSTLAATLLLCATSAIALGVKPTNSCPSSTSGYFLVDVDGWWDVSVAGFEAEGIPVYEADGVTYTDEFNASPLDSASLMGPSSRRSSAARSGRASIGTATAGDA